MRYMKVNYHMTKMILIKLFTICSSNRLGLELIDQSGALNSPFFTILRNKRNILGFRGFLQPPYTEPVALFMKFPICVSDTLQSKHL